MRQLAVAASLSLTVFLQPVVGQTAFTSIHVFSDGVATTTDNTDGIAPRFGNRFCNGPVWVEVLSEWQGLTYVESNNVSAFNFESADILDILTDPASPTPYVTPADVATGLFVLWTNNADYVEFLNGTSDSGVMAEAPFDDPEDLPQWQSFGDNVIDQHEMIVQELYDRGVRTLVIPLAVDFLSVPVFSNFQTSDRDFAEARVSEFNAGLQQMLDSLLPTLPGLTVYVPDAFDLFEEILSDPSAFGATVSNIGATVDLFNPVLSLPTLDGPGADYVFWDQFHPTARIQVFIADLFQQAITPAQVTGIDVETGEIEIINAPVGRPGFVVGSDDLLIWDLDVPSFTSTSTLHTESVPVVDPTRFFQVGFPVPEANLPTTGE